MLVMFVNPSRKKYPHFKKNTARRLALPMWRAVSVWRKGERKDGLYLRLDMLWHRRFSHCQRQK